MCYSLRRVLAGLSLVFMPCALTAQEGNGYGLKFISHEDIKDNRTSLILTPGEDMRPGDDFTLSFDVQLHGGEQTFGYIFRVIADDKTNLDMISDVSAEVPAVRLVEGNNIIAEVPIGGEQQARDRWISVSVEVARSRGEVTLSVDSIRQTVPLGMDGKLFKMWFGACDHFAFYTTDVPPMTLRDVRILDGRGNLSRHWKLGRHNGNAVWDESANHPAETQNPVWLLDSYARWRERCRMLIPEENLNMAAKADGSAIYFVAGNTLAMYENGPDPRMEVTSTGNRMPFTVQPNQVVFDDARGLLVAYELESQATAVLDPEVAEEPRWSAAAESTPVPRFWQHNAAFVPQSGAIVTFGGYGEHIYKSRVNVIASDGRWTDFDLAGKLAPRYLSGMAVTDDGRLLIAGGYGNDSGLQSESPHNFYDILSVDPLTGEVEQVCELIINPDDEHFVFGRDMVIANGGKRVFALIYSDKRYASEIELAGIELATGNLVRYADMVPYRFSDIASFCTLVMDRARGEFLLVSMHKQRDEGTMVEIWALEAPPLRIHDTVQEVRQGRSFPWWMVGLAVLFATGGAAILLWRRIRLGQQAAKMPVPVTEPAITPGGDYKTYRIEKHPSSILLLGGFQVVDKTGKDITGQFTQTVRALFLLILLETVKNGRGIASQLLNDTLWFDKDPENARNNRNVNINKLRKLLSEVGRVEVSSSNSYWHMTLGNDIFCDYHALLETGREIMRDGGKSLDPAKVDDLVALASLGKLLPNIQTEWSDAYKADFSVQLIEQLLKIAAMPSVNSDPRVVLRIADAILIHDNLDEDAMRMKCLSLVRMGKKNQAKQAYNAFVADFKKVLDAEPDLHFSDMERELKV